MCSFIMVSSETIRGMGLEWWNKDHKKLQWDIGIKENLKELIKSHHNNINLTKVLMPKFKSSK